MKEIDRYGYILEALSETIDEADYFNEILSSKTKVKARKRPFEIQRLDPKEYLENPYYRMVHPTGAKEGAISLEYDAYEANEGFVYDEIKTIGLCREKTPFGFFEQRFPFLAIKEGDTTWMSITPHEINTMKKPIEEAHGNVVTLGLGLGYFAFMASMKNDVTSLTVVESNETMIKIFEEKILPFFPRREKIKIIKDDAFHFLEGDYKADYLFADLWHMPEDGLPLYAKTISFEEKHPKTSFSYWIEDSMLALIRRAVLILIDEEMLESVDENYLHEETFSDHLINQIHFILKEKEIHGLPELEKIVNKQSLKAIASKLTFVNKMA